MNLADPKKRLFNDDQLVTRREPRPTRQDRQVEFRANLAAVFPGRDSVRVAVREGFITGRQGFVLQQGLWYWSERASWTTNCQRIAGALGWSRSTVSREFGRIVDAICRPRPTADLASKGGYRVTREHGERAKRRVWTVSENRVGHRRRPRAQLVSSRERRRVLRERPRSDDEVLVPIRTSRMRRLLVALAACAIGQTDGVGREVSSSDWALNRRWVERRIQTAKRETRPTLFAEAASVLSRGYRVCRFCHTPILVGCRIDGVKVTRGREFCDPSCREAHRRRHATNRVTGSGAARN